VCSTSGQAAARPPFLWRSRQAPLLSRWSSRRRGKLSFSSRLCDSWNWRQRLKRPGMNSFCRDRTCTNRWMSSRFGQSVSKRGRCLASKPLSGPADSSSGLGARRERAPTYLRRSHGSRRIPSPSLQEVGLWCSERAPSAGSAQERVRRPGSVDPQEAGIADPLASHRTLTFHVKQSGLYSCRENRLTGITPLPILAPHPSHRDPRE